MGVIIKAYLDNQHKHPTKSRGTDGGSEIRDREKYLQGIWPATLRCTGQRTIVRGTELMEGQRLEVVM